MRRLLLACAVVALPFVPAMAQGPAAPATALGPSLTPPDGSLVASGPSPAVTLLYTGDTIGFVDPCG